MIRPLSDTSSSTRVTPSATTFGRTSGASRISFRSAMRGSSPLTRAGNFPPSGFAQATSFPGALRTPGYPGVLPLNLRRGRFDEISDKVQRTRDQQPLDLAGALADLQDLRVAVEAADRVLVHEAIAAED